VVSQQTWETTTAITHITNGNWDPEQVINAKDEICCEVFLPSQPKRGRGQAKAVLHEQECEI
jgi:hypothetical protein